jgi:hypothetical protein
MHDHRNELKNKIATTLNAIKTGAIDTVYNAPYPTQSGSISAMPVGFSFGSLPIGGLASGALLHGAAASSAAGVVGGASASTPASS